MATDTDRQGRPIPAVYANDNTHGAKRQPVSPRVAPRRQSHEHPLVTAVEAARILGVERRTIYAAIKRGDLPGQKLGRRYFVPREAVESIGQTHAKGRVRIPA
jgi:excisionase family DNA binding protein